MEGIDLLIPHLGDGYCFCITCARRPHIEKLRSKANKIPKEWIANLVFGVFQSKRVKQERVNKRSPLVWIKMLLVPFGDFIYELGLKLLTILVKVNLIAHQDSLLAR